MSPENFAYWLQGYFEIGKSDELTKEQVEEIKNHLKLVFVKLTPEVKINYQPKTPEELKRWWEQTQIAKPLMFTC